MSLTAFREPDPDRQFPVYFCKEIDFATVEPGQIEDGVPFPVASFPAGARLIMATQVVVDEATAAADTLDLGVEGSLSAILGGVALNAEAVTASSEALYEIHTHAAKTVYATVTGASGVPVAGKVAIIFGYVKAGRANVVDE